MLKIKSDISGLFNFLTIIILTFVLGAIFISSNAHGKIKCGGPFIFFLSDIKKTSVSMGYSVDLVNDFFSTAEIDPEVLKADQSQTIFRKSFFEFSNAVISPHRLQNAAINKRRYKQTFSKIKHQYGVPKEILLAFWALETDFGLFQGDYNTLNALLTLSHDCRRPELFLPQVFGALELFKQNKFHPRATKGAWAGEIGMLQMLPLDLLENGADGDGDGEVDITSSPIDALYSMAKKLTSMGWKRNQPWLLEVRVPESMDWFQTGLSSAMPIEHWRNLSVRPRVGSFQNDADVSLVLPMGRKGPAFFTYPNYKVLLNWNNSFVYITTAAYFATLLSNEPRYRLGSPEPMLSTSEMLLLQSKLHQKGYNVGKIDGILGKKTREAVKLKQKELNIPADGWPTKYLLKNL